MSRQTSLFSACFVLCLSLACVMRVHAELFQASPDCLHGDEFRGTVTGKDGKSVEIALKWSAKDENGKITSEWLTKLGFEDYRWLGGGGTSDLKTEQMDFAVIMTNPKYGDQLHLGGCLKSNLETKESTLTGEIRLKAKAGAEHVWNYSTKLVKKLENRTAKP